MNITSNSNPQLNLLDYKANLLLDLEFSKFGENLWQFFKTIDDSLIFLQVFFYDPDLESVGEIINYGDSKYFIKQDFIESNLSLTDLNKIIDIKNKTKTVLYQVFNFENQLLGGLVFNELKTLDREKLINLLNSFPLAKAFSNVYEFNELRNATNRLRNRYEDLENQNLKLTEDTRNIINKLNYKDCFIFENLRREKIIYFISSKAAEYQEIEDVANAIVGSIGKEYNLSNCILILSKNIENKLKNNIFEFTGNSDNSIAKILEHTYTNDLVEVLFKLKSPQEFYSIEGLDSINKDFVSELNLNSSLIIPIISGDTTQAVLILNNIDNNVNWSIDQISLLTTLSGILGVTLTNAYLRDVIKQQAVTDGLTGIFNRRSFNEALTKEFERARRYQEILSLIVIDLDHLKKINDNFGHKYGDEAIIAIAKVLKNNCRTNDFTARYGGEEFCLILPNTDGEMALQIAERIRKLINEVYIDGPGLISASLGLASYPTQANDMESLFNLADEALYEAKKNGRNQVKIAKNLASI